MQQLVQRGASGRVIVVARASQRGAMAAGASKAIAGQEMEFPEFRCQRVFIDDRGGRDTAALLPLAARWAATHHAETDILAVLRRGRAQPSLRAPRLRPVPAARMVPASVGMLPLELGLSYVVSGGMGGVGSALVAWLIDQQGVPPANVVVLTRRTLGGPHPRGATVVTVDVSDRDALLASESLAWLSSVGGIFHLAAVLEDKLMTNIEGESEIARSVGPKAGGAANLQALAVWTRPGRLRTLSVFHYKSILYGAFVWARRALNGPKRWFSARADSAWLGRRLVALLLVD